MAINQTEGATIVLKELTDSNFALLKTATYWAQVEGDDKDKVVLYEYRRKGSEHTFELIELDQEEFEMIAHAMGYVKEIE